jgi:hypothetical protein
MYRYIRSDIYFQDDNTLDIDYYNQNHKGISTLPGKGSKKINQALTDRPCYETDSKFLEGHTVYSVYPYKHAQSDIIRALKKGLLNSDDYFEWIESTASYIVSSIISKNKPDILLCPASSSNLVFDVANEISKQSGIQLLDNAFIKNPVSQITLDIDESHKAYPIAVKALDNVVKQGKFEAKRVPKQTLKFFKNIYRGDSAYADIVSGKDVAIIDDSMSSSSSMMNMMDVCENVYNVNSVYGITVFKRVGSFK